MPIHVILYFESCESFIDTDTATVNTEPISCYHYAKYCCERAANATLLFIDILLDNKYQAVIDVTMMDYKKNSYIVTKVVNMCSVYNAASNEPNFSLLSQVAKQLDLSSIIF